MYRTLLCAMLALFLTAGLTYAEKKGKGKKVKPVGGTVTKFDAGTGALTITKGKKGKATTADFKLTDSVNFVVYQGDTSKNLSGKDGFKELKSGDKVKIKSDSTGKVTSVEINPPKKKKK